MSNPRPDSAHLIRSRPLLDIPGCAHYIASSVRHVRRMVAERTIPHYKVGHFVRFDPDDIDQWLRQNGRGPHDPTPPPVPPVRARTGRRSAPTEPSSPPARQLQFDAY